MGVKKLSVKQVSRLAEKYLRGKASGDELKMLHNWYDTVNAGNTEMVMVQTPTSSNEIREEILAGLKEQIEQEKYRIDSPKRRPVQWWYAAAAILMLVAGTAVYRSFAPNPENAGPSSSIVSTKEVSAPQSARAVITLASGNKLFLDSLPDGTVTFEGNTRIVKKADGQVIYQSMGNALSLQYNVLRVPRGSRVVNLTLTDGTRIWLNAESSMRYPVAFKGDTRQVEITGEAYFEVSKDPQRRFYVVSRGLTTEVLGTHFNVNTYEDESAMKVTLLEGSVHVSYSNGGQAILKPGQQASIAGTGSPEIQVLSDIDTQSVIAWKNEHFMMKGTDLGTLARQMARWYDIEVVFEGRIPDRKFGGSISRNVNLSTMLRALKESGIDSKLEGRKVTIK